MTNVEASSLKYLIEGLYYFILSRKQDETSEEFYTVTLTTSVKVPLTLKAHIIQGYTDWMKFVEFLDIQYQEEMKKNSNIFIATNNTCSKQSTIPIKLSQLETISSFSLQKVACNQVTYSTVPKKSTESVQPQKTLITILKPLSKPKVEDDASNMVLVQDSASNMTSVDDIASTCNMVSDKDSATNMASVDDIDSNMVSNKDSATNMASVDDSASNMVLVKDSDSNMALVEDSASSMASVDNIASNMDSVDDIDSNMVSNKDSATNMASVDDIASNMVSDKNGASNKLQIKDEQNDIEFENGVYIDKAIDVINYKIIDKTEDTVVAVDDANIVVEDAVVKADDTVVAVKDTAVAVEDTVVVDEDTVVSVTKVVEKRDNLDVSLNCKNTQKTDVSVEDIKNCIDFDSSIVPPLPGATNVIPQSHNTLSANNECYRHMLNNAIKTPVDTEQLLPTIRPTRQRKRKIMPDYECYYVHKTGLNGVDHQVPKKILTRKKTKTECLSVNVTNNKKPSKASRNTNKKIKSVFKHQTPVVSDTQKEFDQKDYESTLEMEIDANNQSNTDVVQSKRGVGVQCKICGHKCTSWSNLNRYHMPKHSDEQPFFCTVCDKHFKTEKNLKIHLFLHTGLRPFSCDVCGKTFSLKATAQAHEMSCKGKKNFICHICGKALARKNNLRQHVLRHSEKRPFNCDLCGKSYVSGYELRIHKESHTGIKSLSVQCDICGKQISSNSALKHHVQIHTTDRTFICEICNFAFKTKLHLSNHKGKVHSTLKRLPCPECSKDFKNIFNLRRHKQTTHNDARPFKCLVCLKRFKRNHLLQQHSRVHSAEKEYCCKICQKRFTFKSSLHSHSKLHKRDIKNQGNQSEESMSLNISNNSD